jgi:hypothetical protein
MTTLVNQMSLTEIPTRRSAWPGLAVAGRRRPATAPAMDWNYQYQQ